MGSQSAKSKADFTTTTASSAASEPTLLGCLQSIKPIIAIIEFAVSFAIIAIASRTQLPFN